MLLPKHRDTYVDNREEEAPPAGEDEEASAVADKVVLGLLVRVEAGNNSRRDHGNDEGQEGEDTEGDRVTAADCRAKIDHGIGMQRLLE